MHFTTLLGLAATASAVSVGFNYGNMLSDGTAKTTADYQAEFQAAQSLAGTNGEFTSARLYTMIQAGTTNTPIQAIQAAINTKTTLLLGMWASQDQAGFQNEITALQSAISQYGSDFANLVVGLSVGSEDLYRETPTGIANKAGVGQSPDVLVSYIKQARSTIAGTGLSGVPVGHVDTWTAWVNSSNFEVTDNCDWLGVDSYPYFETSVANAISDGNATFWDSYDQTVSASQGKPVWVTETGWPVSGPVSGQAVASTANAEIYWQEVACSLLGHYNTWWYTLQDAEPTVPSPSFGIVGSNLNSAPLYDLTCKKSSSSSAGGNSSSTGNSTASATGTYATLTTGAAGSATSVASGASGTAAAATSGSSGSGSGSGSGTSTNTAPKSGAAAGAGILAIFALVATL
ncbi:glycoside hydrolase superfamily [Neohortaea acidophila]|uniref:Probable glucan endo-1,3-beta-glucosidase eglC n=1 Tax=Neohortaea acidophila TaxID=245834 RepID=A0A6A6PMD8_9PEZI|nr:glycoside hydrolase superfamily [Neohortaea acidophila]KAF2480976.1 glycoside hydrolase superfamily [Neohortaea acidophila]